MRAILFYRHGGPEVLQLEERPTPEPGPGEALVRVEACGLNHVDLLARSGRVFSKISFPRIPGSEVAGQVAALGPGVNLPLGLGCAVHARLSCGRCEYCLKGEDNVCLAGRALGLEVDGGYAEYVAVPESNVVPLPEGVSYQEAASSTLSALTAYHMLVTRAKVRPGEDVLILAAASGIGSAAVQIAKLMGARVIATVGSEAKVAQARALGADHVLLHRDRPFDEEVRRWTGKKGADVVFEHVGAATWERSLNCLARNGRLVTCGAHTGGEARLDLWRLFLRQTTLIGSYLGTRGELSEVLRLLSRKQLKAIIHKVYPLEKAAEAHRELEESRHFGKILLEP